MESSKYADPAYDRSDDRFALMRADHDFEEYEIKEVALNRDDGEKGTWVVTLEYGFMLEWPRGSGSPQPKVGQTCRIYGDVDGVWGPRGAVIVNASTQGHLDQIAYYRTLTEQSEWCNEKEILLFQAAKIVFKEQELELRKRFEALPKNLQTRVELARQATGDVEKFDVFELESEIVRCEHGHMIALVMDTAATLDTFSRIPNLGQMGYSWNAMCVDRLAVIEKICGGASAPEETLIRLREEAKYLKRYQEQRFVVRHSAEALSDIFAIAADLVAQEVRLPVDVE
jgi:hypothetical protein